MTFLKGRKFSRAERQQQQRQGRKRELAIALLEAIKADETLDIATLAKRAGYDVGGNGAAGRMLDLAGCHRDRQRRLLPSQDNACIAVELLGGEAELLKLWGWTDAQAGTWLDSLPGGTV